jgi:hypothetical protein
MAKVELIGAVIMAIALFGCTTKMQSRSTASLDLTGVDYGQAFREATQAAVDAGFTITSANKDAGLITATRGSNRLFTYQDPAINITVLDNQQSVRIHVNSTVGGQAGAWGTNTRIVREYCEAFRAREPTAVCHS